MMKPKPLTSKGQAFRAIADRAKARLKCTLVTKPRRAAFVTALILFPMSSPLPAEEAAPSQAETKAKEAMAPYIGQPLWTNFLGIQVCPDRTTPKDGKCTVARGEFKFDSFEGSAGDDVVLMHLTFVNGPSGFAHLSPSALIFLFQTHNPTKPSGIYPAFFYHPKDKAQAAEAALGRARPGVELGMNKEQVLVSAWGGFDELKMEDTERGHLMWWFYADGRMLFFVNDKLVEIHQAKE